MGDNDISVSYDTKIYKLCEYAGRICYNSRDKITPDSYRSFLTNIIKSKHVSVLGHGYFVARIRGKNNMLIRQVIDNGTHFAHYQEYFGRMDVQMNLRALHDVIEHMTKYYKFYTRNTKFEEAISCIYTIAYLFDEIFEEKLDRFFELYKSVIHTRKHPAINPYFTDPNVEIEKVLKSYQDDVLKHQLWIGDIDVKIISILNFGYSKDFADMNGNKHLGLPDNMIPEETEYPLGSITFEVTVPRSISHQEARHNISDISQLSQRYVNESEGKDYSLPTLDNINYEIDVQFPEYDGPDKMVLSPTDFRKLSRSMYQKMIENGGSKQNARNTLTNAAYTTMVITKPFYTLPKYFHERCGTGAQPEIRYYATIIRNELDALLDQQEAENSIY